MTWLVSRISHTALRDARSRHFSAQTCLEQQRPRRLAERLPFPTVATCPEPTCACAPMPKLPPGLPIDYTAPLGGLVAAYSEHVLVCTGRADWPSKIEDADGGANVAAALKTLFGRGGPYADPFHHVSVLNASLGGTGVVLLPSFVEVPGLAVGNDVGDAHLDARLDALARGFLLPPTLHAAHDALDDVHRARLTRSPEARALLPEARPVHDVFVLICGHGGRDARCGILGPILQAAFETELARHGFGSGSDQKGRVGLVSHIGGHKFAGNVIVYIPPTLQTADGQAHPLAGYGVWYGRVEPRHVEGLVRETVLAGRVVTDHLRGAIRPDRTIVRG